MSADQILELLRAHDPAQRLPPLRDEQREQLRQSLVSARSEPPWIAGARQPRRRARRGLALLAATLAVLGIVGGGIAASRLLKSATQEEQGLLGGSALFIGTHPSCTTVSEQQFHCVLESAPTVEYVVGSYLGAKMQTVDSSQHIDGGCIARSDDGLIWDCYLGQAAVTHEIIDAAMLGQFQPAPSHG